MYSVPSIFRRQVRDVGQQSAAGGSHPSEVLSAAVTRCDGCGTVNRPGSRNCFGCGQPMTSDAGDAEAAGEVTALPVSTTSVRRRNRGPRWPWVVMGLWLAAFFVWSSGSLRVPAFGPWCDYSQSREVVSIDPVMREGVVYSEYLNVETKWSPPGWRCASGAPLERAQIENGGPISDPIVGRDVEDYLLQLIVLLVPIFSWWAAKDSAWVIPARRRISAVLIAGGVVAGGWGFAGVVGTSTYYGLVFLGIGVVLAVFGVLYRRRHPDGLDVPEQPPGTSADSGQAVPPAVQPSSG